VFPRLDEMYHPRGCRGTDGRITAYTRFTDKHSLSYASPSNRIHARQSKKWKTLEGFPRLARNGALNESASVAALHSGRGGFYPLQRFDLRRPSDHSSTIITTTGPAIRNAVSTRSFPYFVYFALDQAFTCLRLQFLARYWFTECVNLY